MNDLTEKFAGKFTCLGFPTNQFGKQTNEKDWELLPMLAHVRPGGGFVPNFPIFTKTEANGEGASDLFKFLRSSLGAPSDDFKGQGSDYVISTKNIIWTPVTRADQRPATTFERFGPGKRSSPSRSVGTDLAWNFEKFLINQEGKPVKRYSPGFLTADVAADVEALLEHGPDALG